MSPELASLAALPLLEGASEAELETLAGLTKPGRASPGEVLGREGEAGRTFWLLIAGRVAVTLGGHHLADAGPGSILGELALLRGRPRSATVTAVEECRFLSGGADALERMLDIAPVRSRLRRLASSRLAQDLKPVHMSLGDGTSVVVRPLLPSDRPALDQALHNMSRDSIRRRFFTAGTPSPTLVDYLIDIDYVDHFAWVVMDAGTHDGMATGRYVRRPGDPEAEMAFTTVDRYQGRGLGTFLLGALGATAVEAGITSLFAHVMDDNVPMRRVFAKAEGLTHFDEPGLVRVSVDPERAAALLDSDIRRQLAEAVRDVVTAASLALRV